MRSVDETAIWVTGSARKRCDGRPFWEIPWWRDAAEVREAVERARTGETVRFQTRFETTVGVRAALTVLIPAGDEVRSVLAVGQDLTVTVGDIPDGFYVADDGPGVSPADRDRVFERGVASGGGTGLGLPIVERVVDIHGWSVGVTESERGGARFEVNDVGRRP